MLSFTSKIVHVLKISCSICCQLVGLIHLSLSCLLEVQVLYVLGSRLSWADLKPIAIANKLRLFLSPSQTPCGPRLWLQDNSSYYFFCSCILYCTNSSLNSFIEINKHRFRFGLFLICFDSSLIHRFVVGWSEPPLEHIFLFFSADLDHLCMMLLSFAVASTGLNCWS